MSDTESSPESIETTINNNEDIEYIFHDIERNPLGMEKKISNMTLNEIEETFKNNPIQTESSISYELFDLFETRLTKLRQITKKTSEVNLLFIRLFQILQELEDKVLMPRDGKLFGNDVRRTVTKYYYSAEMPEKSPPAEFTNMFVEGVSVLYGEVRHDTESIEKDHMDSLKDALQSPHILDIPLKDFINTSSSEDMKKFFENEDEADEFDLKGLHFLANVCKIEEKLLRKIFNGKNGKKDFDSTNVRDFVYATDPIVRGGSKIIEDLNKMGSWTYLAHVPVNALNLLSGRTFFKNILPTKKDSSLQLESISEDIHDAKHDALRKRLEEVDPYKIMDENERNSEGLDVSLQDQEGKFLKFCAMFTTKKIKGLHIGKFGPDIQKDKVIGPNLKLFILTLKNLHEKIQSWGDYLGQYGHNDEFSGSIKQALQKSLTIGDAMQIYLYMNDVRGDSDKIPESPKKTDPMVAFFLQMKMGQVIAEADGRHGNKFKMFLLDKGARSAISNLEDEVNVSEETLAMINRFKDQIFLAWHPGKALLRTPERIGNFYADAHDVNLPVSVAFLDVLPAYAGWQSGRLGAALVRRSRLKSYEMGRIGIEAVADFHGVSLPVAEEIREAAINALGAFRDSNPIWKRTTLWGGGRQELKIGIDKIEDILQREAKIPGNTVKNIKSAPNLLSRAVGGGKSLASRTIEAAKPLGRDLLQLIRNGRQGPRQPRRGFIATEMFGLPRRGTPRVSPRVARHATRGGKRWLGKLPLIGVAIEGYNMRQNIYALAESGDFENNVRNAMKSALESAGFVRTLSKDGKKETYTKGKTVLTVNDETIKQLGDPQSEAIKRISEDTWLGGAFLAAGGLTSTGVGLPLGALIASGAVTLDLAHSGTKKNEAYMWVLGQAPWTLALFGTSLTGQSEEDLLCSTAGDLIAGSESPEEVRKSVIFVMTMQHLGKNPQLMMEVTGGDFSPEAVNEFYGGDFEKFILPTVLANGFSVGGKHNNPLKWERVRELDLEHWLDRISPSAIKEGAAKSVGLYRDVLMERRWVYWRRELNAAHEAGDTEAVLQINSVLRELGKERVLGTSLYLADEEIMHNDKRRRENGEIKDDEIPVTRAELYIAQLTGQLDKYKSLSAGEIEAKHPEAFRVDALDSTAWKRLDRNDGLSTLPEQFAIRDLPHTVSEQQSYYAHGTDFRVRLDKEKTRVADQKEEQLSQTGDVVKRLDPYYFQKVHGEALAGMRSYERMLFVVKNPELREQGQWVELEDEDGEKILGINRAGTIVLIKQTPKMLSYKMFDATGTTPPPFWKRIAGYIKEKLDGAFRGRRNWSHWAEFQNKKAFDWTDENEKASVLREVLSLPDLTNDMNSIDRALILYPVHEAHTARFRQAIVQMAHTIDADNWEHRSIFSGELFRAMRLESAGLQSKDPKAAEQACRETMERLVRVANKGLFGEDVPEAMSSIAWEDIRIEEGNAEQEPYGPIA